MTPPAGAAHGCELVLTADAIVGGVHFFADDPPTAVAKKALRVNLSDLAAKGAKPPAFCSRSRCRTESGTTGSTRLRAGSGRCEQYECPLLGGDTGRTPGPVTVSIATFGTVPHGTMVRRGGARVWRSRGRDWDDR